MLKQLKRANVDSNSTKMYLLLPIDNWKNKGDHRLISLNCGHLFGESCIRRWVNERTEKYSSKQATCPICAKQIKLSQIRNVQPVKLVVQDTSSIDKLTKELDAIKTQIKEQQNALELSKLALSLCQRDFTSEDEVDFTFDDLDEKDMDLREYAKQIITEKILAQEELEKKCNAENVQSFVDLHTEIQFCDQVLGRMEELLNVFQSDLGNISGEIQNLQEKSTFMNLKLKNRKTLESRLGKALQGMVIPPYMIK
ncbi:hypothetical protein RO3G_16949 [Rhizopus delemar RA 99-880]|uniref:RING-type domain-containing protein n=1 Tax=Rhizopus delemar (strain RA 99-880 / ATCC MYA-4621 / FGSC 9543 / NRRL 43880) TaxID=246409 RepID=I1CVE7_RHIO9|nr:hypothetical protein RO3G_16949 [Rhizopus delemar RA 99-880]|eukprot:EIE92427.1 hypothetical protein RO3G_16949 [Rhizopus delemar RA 99-880]